VGWDFTKGATKADVVRELTAGYGAKCLAHCVRGEEFYGVYESESGQREIVVVVLENNQGFGWGSKVMCESMHPYYFNCPVKYLSMAPVTNEAWRAKVRAHHSGHGGNQTEMFSD